MVRPVVWRPPAEPSPAEQAVIKAVRRAKLFVFLRQHRHELFDEQFQAELAETYVDSPKGQPPVPPARLALATILQAYTKVSDDEVIEATVMDRRWQLVLDCMGAEEPPFSKGTLVGFRKRLIERDLDRRLVERTVELAARDERVRRAGAAGGAGLQSPLWGAGRVEDTFNLMGHALRKALGVIAVLQGRGQAAGTAVRGGAGRGAGAGRLQPEGGAGPRTGTTRPPGTRRWPRCWACWTGWRPSSPGRPATRPRPRRWRPPARSATRTWTWPGRRRRCAAGSPGTGGSASRTARCGTAASPARCCSTATSGTCCATWTPAWCPPWGSPRPTRRRPASPATSPPTWRPPGGSLAELHIDRAYLSSALVRDRGPDLAVFCKAWRVRNTGGRFAKDQFTLDFAAGQLTCPAGVSHAVRARQDRPLPQGHLRGLPAAGTGAPPAATGAASSIHPDEALLAELRQRQQTPEGRAKLRERVAGRARPRPRRALAGPPRPLPAAPARTCSTCAASPSSTTSTSSPASPSPTVTS